MKEIKYSFYLGKTNKTPYVKIESNIQHFSSEINNLSGQFIKQIVTELEEVKKGEREYCTGIGHEMIIITCYGPNDKEYPNSALIEYDYCEKSMVVPFDDIYNLMKDLKEYLEKWEKETGLEKKGL